MNGILVDSNVILDVVTEDPNWFEWSAHILAKSADKYPLFINAIIYAEVSVGFGKIEQLEEIISSEVFTRSTIPWEAAFLAGKAFKRYKMNGGKRSAPLPDFFIGAHALIDNLKLLTRDGERFNYYFPRLRMISPKSGH